MLNSNDVGSQPCLVPDLNGNAFKISPQNMMFAVGFFNRISFIPFIPSWQSFIMSGCQLLANALFFCIYLDDHMLLKDFLM